MNNSTRTNSLWFIVGVVFVTLKLCGVLDWSWLWVLAPFWLPVVVSLSVAIFVLAANNFLRLFTSRAPSRQKRGKR